MQAETFRRPNPQRSAEMRARLLAAARRLFAENGYAATSTPEIVAAADVTRGALYHHFRDKEALFRAVVEDEAAAVAAEIEARSAGVLSAREGLLAGAKAYLAAMQESGRTRLLLLEGPAVLGRDAMDALDAEHAARTLREGLAGATASGAIERLPQEALTLLLSALFDRAALAVDSGHDPADLLQVIEALVTGLTPRR